MALPTLEREPGTVPAGPDRPQPARRRRAPPAPPTRPRILLTTEGTYPDVVGGVSSWCDLLVKGMPEFDWQIMPIAAAHGRPPVFELPAHAREVGRIEVWSEELPRGARLRRSERRARCDLPDVLVRKLMGW